MNRGSARIRVGLARLVLVAPLLIALAILLSIPVHVRIAPYGQTGTVTVLILSLLSYGAAFVALLFGMFFVVTEFCLSFYTLWAMSFRQPHTLWRHRWKAWEDKNWRNNHPEFRVTYDKPPPMIRGRIGSK